MVPAGPEALLPARLGAIALAPGERMARLTQAAAAGAPGALGGLVAATKRVQVGNAVVLPTAPAVLTAKGRRVAARRRAPADAGATSFTRPGLAGLARKDVVAIA